MSGTSLDGIDAVLVDFSTDQPQLIATHYQPYKKPLIDSLLSLHQPSSNELHQSQVIANQLARENASALQALLKSANVSAAKVRAAGCHGQTIRHRPDHGYTIQLGNAALLAELSGITVVSDFRSRDIAAGGQGAPLVPAFHDQVLRDPGTHRVIVNIGGISNLTNLKPGHVTTGFDCGPGNLLMDAWISQHRGQPYDRDGAWAATGQVIPVLLKTLLKEPYLRAAPPKSTGRDLFNLEWLSSKLVGNEPAEDVQATLLALTSYAIADAIKRYCAGAQEVYLCGGGAHNQALINHLALSLPDCSLQTTEALGMGVDWLEAIAFAWLAKQAILGRNANLPSVTGAKHPCILGAIYSA